jgi:hypothetical protein
MKLNVCSSVVKCFSLEKDVRQPYKIQNKISKATQTAKQRMNAMGATLRLKKQTKKED